MNTSRVNLSSVKRKIYLCFLVFELLSLAMLAQNNPVEEVKLQTPAPSEQKISILIKNNPGSFYDPVKIEFTLPESRVVFVKIFNLNGEELYDKRLGYHLPGTHNTELIAEGLQVPGNFILALFTEDQLTTVQLVRM